MPHVDLNYAWWGYRHTNGTVQAKRFRTQLDIKEAHESWFCAKVVEPFNAKSREEALAYIEAHT